MSTPSERLQTIIKTERLRTVNQLAKEIGYSQSSLSRIILGKWKEITRNLADAIVKRYPQYSLGWLLTGEGDMLAEPEQESSTMGEEERQRLNKYLRYKGITQKKFQQMLRQINLDQKAASTDPVQQISLTFPDLNRNWLLTGSGNMLLYTDPAVIPNNLDERERLQLVIDNESLKNASGLAKAIGYNQSNLSKVMTGKWKMNANLAAAINRTFPKYSVAWLMTGEDDNAVLVEEKSVEEVGTNSHGAVFLRDDHGQLYISVPHVPYAARAEFANIADTLTPYREEWGTETYEADKRVTGTYLSFDVKGDSMDDGSRGSLQDGDKVLVRELERDDWRNPLKFREHPYWVVVFGSSVLIKQIISEDMDNGTITFHSLNPSPEYSDFTLNIDDIRTLYYVIRVKPKSFAL